jgi:hypothetical protein
VEIKKPSLGVASTGTIRPSFLTPLPNRRGGYFSVRVEHDEIKPTARIVYHLLSTQESYHESVFHRCEEQTLRRAEFRLRKQAAQLGFQVTPVQND